MRSCGICKRQVHTACLPAEFEGLGTFYCRNCCCSSTGHFDFSASLLRLQQADDIGSVSLRSAAVREESLVIAYAGAMPLQARVNFGQLLANEGIEH